MIFLLPFPARILMLGSSRYTCLIATFFLIHSAESAVVLDQIGNANTYILGPGLASAPSQIVADFPDSSSMVLDDFTVTTTGLRISSISALFRAENGFASFSNLTAYSIAIFSAPGLAATSLTGDIANLQVMAGSGVSVARITGPPGGFDYGLVSLAVDIPLAAAGTYWLGIAPQTNSTIGDFRLLSNGAYVPVPPGNNDAKLANPGLELGAGALSSLGADYAYAVATVPEPAAGLLWIIGSIRFLLRRRRPQSTYGSGEI